METKVYFGKEKGWGGNKGQVLFLEIYEMYQTNLL